MMKSMARVFFLIMTLFATILLYAREGTAASGLRIETVRYGVKPGHTRLVLELDRAAEFRVFSMTGPDRVVIDLPEISWMTARNKPPSGAGIVSVRRGVLQPGISRIVLDLDAPLLPRSASVLARTADQPFRLVIDFDRVTPAAYAAGKSRVLGTLGSPPVSASGPAPGPASVPGTLGTLSRSASGVLVRPDAAAPPRPGVKPPGDIAAPVPPQVQVPVKTPSSGVPLKTPSSGVRPMIVIDAGHGGQDPGAMGVNGTPEKNITLAMARELKKQLEATGRYRVALTRDKDIFLKLQQRVAIARGLGADLFISLHADSVDKPNIGGASIYTLSEKASDEQTEKLAARENKADLIAGVDISHESADVANILIDLALRDTMNQSKFFANTVVSQMKGRSVGLLDNPHRFAGFAVLKAPDIPSVLIELGFMSNRREAEMLSRPEHRTRVAAAIVDSVHAYFGKVQKSAAP